MVYARYSCGEKYLCELLKINVTSSSRYRILENAISIGPVIMMSFHVQIRVSCNSWCLLLKQTTLDSGLGPFHCSSRTLILHCVELVTHFTSDKRSEDECCCSVECNEKNTFCRFVIEM